MKNKKEKKKSSKKNGKLILNLNLKNSTQT
jgi:hypothetical protein